MSDNNDAFSSVVHSGWHPSKTQTMVWNIHGFEHVEATMYTSPRMFCNGYHWTLTMYPNGTCEGDQDVFFCLCCDCCEVEEGSVENFRAKYSLQAANQPTSILDAKLETYSERQTYSVLYGWTRGQAISFCDSNGTLRIEISLQVYEHQHAVMNPWKPGKSTATKVARLYDTKLGSDATFVVGNRRFEAHRFILQLHAPTLADMLLDDNDAAKQTEVPIDDVDPNLFELLLYFLYKEELPPDFCVGDDAVKLLNLADMFGCSELKMLLEAHIIEEPEIFCPQKAAELFVEADAKNCALLRERSLQLIVENIDQVKKTAGWKHVEESTKLLKAIIDAQSTCRSKLDALDNSVSVLRKRAHEKGLDADGSREDLIKRLKGNDDDDDDA